MNSGGDDRYACPGLVPVDGEPALCGLWLGHAGACTPHVGDYLPPPLLHPLDARLVPLRLRATGVACPNGHGARGRWHESSIHGGRVLWDEPWYQVEGPVTALRHHVDGHWLAAETEWLWRFEPCGCEFRQILPAEGC